MKIRYYAASMFVLVMSAFPAFAANDAASIANTTVAALFPSRAVQQKIADCDFKAGKSETFQGVQMSVTSGGDVTLSGKDHSNRVWSSTYKATPGAGCQLWRVDLGRDGLLDLAFVEFGANSSGGWDTTLSLLLFDDQGHPFPWQATSKFSTDDLGVRELVKLGDEKRKAVIVPRRLDEGRGDETVYHAYGFKENRVREILGSYSNKSWPLILPPGVVTSHSYLDSTSLTTAVLVGNLPSPAQDSTHHFLRLEGANDLERQVVFSDGSMMLPKVLVVDSANGRRIISFPQEADFLNLQKLNLTTTTLGQSCDGGVCAALIMWMK
jgi:hypothetical protein